MLYQCTLCGLYGGTEHFAPSARREKKKTGQCRKCLRIRAQEYNNSPKGKATRRAFQQKYEKSDKRRAYNLARKESNKKYSKAYNTRPERRFKDGQRSAAARGISWLLTPQEHQQLLSSGLCDYCKGPVSTMCSGLDRKDSKGPYSVENCVPCCKRCNIMKNNDLTYHEMLAVAKLLKELRSMGSSNCPACTVGDYPHRNCVLR